MQSVFLFAQFFCLITQPFCPRAVATFVSFPALTEELAHPRACLVRTLPQRHIVRVLSVCKIVIMMLSHELGFSKLGEWVIAEAIHKACVHAGAALAVSKEAGIRAFRGV